jgi:hypothetical protein
MLLRARSREVGYLPDLSQTLLANASESVLNFTNKVGVSVSARTAQRRAHEAVLQHPTSVLEFLKSDAALATSAVLLIDDFSLVFVSQLPDNQRQSTAAHVTNVCVNLGAMATSRSRLEGPGMDWPALASQQKKLIDGPRILDCLTNLCVSLDSSSLSTLVAGRIVRPFQAPFVKCAGAGSIQNMRLLDCIGMALKSRDDIATAMLDVFRREFAPYLCGDKLLFAVGDFPVFAGMVTTILRAFAGKLPDLEPPMLPLFRNVVVLPAQWHCWKSLLKGVFLNYYDVVWAHLSQMCHPKGKTLLPSEKMVVRIEHYLRVGYFGYLAMRDTLLPRLRALVQHPGGNVQASLLLHLFEFVLPVVLFYVEICRANEGELFVSKILPAAILVASQLGKAVYRSALVYLLSQLQRWRFEAPELFQSVLARLGDLDEAAIEVFHSRLSANAKHTVVRDLDDLRRLTITTDCSHALSADVERVFELPSRIHKYRASAEGVGVNPRYARMVCTGSYFVEALVAHLESSLCGPWWQLAQCTRGGGVSYRTPLFGLVSTAQLPFNFARPSMTLRCGRVGFVGHKVNHALGKVRQQKCGHFVDKACRPRFEREGRGSLVVNSHCGREECSTLFPYILAADKKKSEGDSSASSDSGKNKAEIKAEKQAAAASTLLCLACSACETAIDPSLVTRASGGKAMAATVIELSCGHVFHVSCRSGSMTTCRVCAASLHAIVTVADEAATRMFMSAFSDPTESKPRKTKTAAAALEQEEEFVAERDGDAPELSYEKVRELVFNRSKATATATAYVHYSDKHKKLTRESLPRSGFLGGKT